MGTNDLGVTRTTKARRLHFWFRLDCQVGLPQMLNLMPRKTRVQYPGAMYHPPSPGSGGRVGADGRRVGAAPGGRIALGKRSSQGRPACGRGTTGPGWISDELVRRPKNVPEELAIAARLRRETTLPLRAIPVRVHLGTSKSANAWRHQWMRKPTRLIQPKPKLP